MEYFLQCVHILKVLYIHAEEFFVKKNLEQGYEEVERYCHVIGKNTSVVRLISGSDRMFNCGNFEECSKNGGCKNCMCKEYKG